VFDDNFSFLHPFREGGGLGFRNRLYFLSSFLPAPSSKVLSPGLCGIIRNVYLPPSHTDFPFPRSIYTSNRCLLDSQEREREEEKGERYSFLGNEGASPSQQPRRRSLKLRDSSLLIEQIPSPSHLLPIQVGKRDGCDKDFVPLFSSFFFSLATFLRQASEEFPCLPTPTTRPGIVNSFSVSPLSLTRWRCSPFFPYLLR